VANQLSNPRLAQAGLVLALILASVALSMSARNRSKRKPTEKTLKQLEQRLGDRDLNALDFDMRKLFGEMEAENAALRKRVDELETRVKKLER